MKEGKELKIAVLLIIIGIAGLWLLSYNDSFMSYSDRGYRTGYSGSGMMGSGGGMMGYPDGGYLTDYSIDDLARTFKSNGEMIYHTGINKSGTMIPVTGGPTWLYMHGGSCVDCHGTNGRGGAPIMMGTAIPSNITYSALIDEGFTDETIKRAIIKGFDEGLADEAKSLDWTMPRWEMTDDDLNDVITYLKALS